MCWSSSADQAFSRGRPLRRDVCALVCSFLHRRSLSFLRTAANHLRITRAAMRFFDLGQLLLLHATPPPPRSVAPVAIDRGQRDRLAFHLKQLKPTCNAAPTPEAACEGCLALLERMRADGLPTSAEAHHAAMGVCSGRLDVVEALFAELRAASLLREASYAALIGAHVATGRGAGRAVELADAMLADPHMRPRLRTCSPLVLALCAADEEAEATRLWGALEARGVCFSPREHAARLGLHGRARAPARLGAALAEMLVRYPTPDAEAVDAIEAAVGAAAGDKAGEAEAEAEATGGELARAERARARRAKLGPDAACGCCGERMQLLGLSSAQRQSVRPSGIMRSAHLDDPGGQPS